ncbi:carbohydrate ABC transporter permease [Pseudonocardia lacus]|uniref:carbohydrate ABC transporter permease n=1 Tax=Pseudonocardia lacus TaxID=2835865 RepID=UPI0027E358B9|nr:carbohydrate ABC transporter permease [Pseudonocardia lacus]
MTALRTPPRLSPHRSPRPAGPAGGRPRTRLAHALMGLGIVYFLVPLLWVVVAATKSQPELLSSPALWFGDGFSLFANLAQLFTEDGGAYGRWLLNTAVYSGVSAVGATLLAALAGYGLARFDFPGRRLFETALLGMVMVPATALVLPTYLLLSTLGIINTMWAVILPSLLSPFGTFLIRVYVAESVPEEIIDAARLDRAGELRIFFRIVLPMMRPALVTVLLFTLVATWNNYFQPLVMLSDADLYPLTVGLTTWFNLSQQAAGTKVVFHLVITGSLLAIVPLVVAFVLLQRFWRGGVATGALR